MKISRPIPVQCAVCGRYYGHPWSHEEPGTARAAILTGWELSDGLWYCHTYPRCRPTLLEAV